MCVLAFKEHQQRRKLRSNALTLQQVSKYFNLVHHRHDWVPNQTWNSFIHLCLNLLASPRASQILKVCNIWAPEPPMTACGTPCEAKAQPKKATQKSTGTESLVRMGYPAGFSSRESHAMPVAAIEFLAIVLIWPRNYSLATVRHPSFLHPQGPSGV